MTSHTLLLLCLLPLIGAGLVWVLPTSLRAGRPLAVVASAVQAALCLPVWAGFNPRLPEFQQVEHWGGVAALGLDGISLLLIPTMAIVGLAAALSVPFGSEAHARRWTAAFLLTQAGAVAVLLSLHLVLLFAGWALLLGGVLSLGRTHASEAPGAGMGRAWLLGGGGLIACGALIGVLFAGAGTGELSLIQARTLSPGYQWAGLLLCAALAATCVLLFVFLPEADGGNLPGSALLAIAVFVLLRVGFALLPDASRNSGVLIAWVSLAGALLLAVQAWRQSRPAAAIDLLAASQTLMAIAGAATLGPQGLTGAILRQCVIVASTAAALLLVNGAAGVGGQVRRALVLASLVPVLVTIVGVGEKSGARLQWTAASSSGPIALAGTLVVSVAALAVLVRIGQLGWSGPVARVTAGTAGPVALVSAAALVAAVVAASVAPSASHDRVTVAALKVAARIDPAYAGAFEAACDTTVTDEMKAANPANQFLAAAPCGPNGEPLPAPSSSVIAPPDASPVPAR